ncbi:MAG: glycosyltransferase family 2 protein [Ruminococcus sp.]|nr:glycosyltransferase family 2 protein [Ruminococcus sp.]
MNSYSPNRRNTISIVIPTYNEEQNIGELVDQLQEQLQTSLPQYDHEILIIDNDSVDGTRGIIRLLCKKYSNVKAIFNERNFGWLRSPVYGLTQASGDCIVMLCADFQDPLDMIPKFVEKWEQGCMVVAGQKTSSGESKLKYAVRSLYYKIIRKFSDGNYLEHFTGFGLYDRKFIDVIRELKDPLPFLRGYVMEFIGDPEVIQYVQPARKHGKSWGSFSRLYDTAMISITAYTKVGLRFATFLGVISAALSFAAGLFYLIYKLTHWFTFSAGMAPIIVGIFFIGGIQLFFLGMIGEYILSINERVKNRPLVIEEERINFDKHNSDETVH